MSDQTSLVDQTRSPTTRSPATEDGHLTGPSPHRHQGEREHATFENVLGTISGTPNPTHRHAYAWHVHGVTEGGENPIDQSSQ